MQFGESPSPSGRITVAWTVTEEDATVTFQQHELTAAASAEMIVALRTFADEYLLRLRGGE